MTKSLRLVIIFFAIVLGTQLYAQSPNEVSVSGQVVDETGTTLPGATVSVVGTTKGTITDLDGKFSLMVSPDDQLSVSFIGYQSEIIDLQGRTFIGVELRLDVQALDEIVVVGYGQVKKSDLTGSISSVDGKAINEIPTPFLDKAIQGQAAGVQVTTASAAPGGGAQIRIRGANSLSSSSDPLFVIDGFPAGVGSSVIQTLNPQDIKSIEILKDASATSIYGSRGANGVVLITTKRGQSGKAQIQYSNFFSIEQVETDLDMLNAQEFAMIYNEYLQNTGQQPFYNGGNRYTPSPDQLGEGTNWVDEITRAGIVQNHQLSILGGSDKSKYSVSAGYIDHAGAIKGGSFNRGVIRINLDNELNNWLSLGTSINLSRNITDGSGDNTDMEGGRGTINAAVKMTPVLPVYDVYGNYTENNIPDAQRRENPLAQALEVDDKNTADNTLANLFLNINPIEGLNLKVSGGANFSNSRSNTYRSTKTIEGAAVGGIAFVSTGRSSNYLMENLLTYDKKIGVHDLKFTALASRQMQVSESTQQQGTGFPSDKLGVNNFLAASEISNVRSYKSQWQLASYMGRVNYVLMDKYLVTATLRADGSSKFGPDNKWGVFPSLAVAWKIQNEAFFDPVSSVVSEAKIRASYGTVGNSEFGLYQSQSLLNISENAVLNDVEVSGTAPQANPGNPDLKWETTTMYNLGLDMGFWQSRLKITADAYLKLTDDFLLGIPLAQTSGYTTITKNIDATIETKGIDLLVDFNVLNVADFNWNILANWSAYRSVYFRFNENDGELYRDQTYIAKGIEVGSFRGQEFYGIFRSEEEIQAYVGPEGDPIQPQAVPGDVRYKDLNNDGIINGDDQRIIGNPNPDFTFGVTNRLSYKNLDLSIFITGSVGNDIRNETGRYLSSVGIIRGNLRRDVLDRWHPENNPNGKFMALGGSGQMPFIEDGTYIRLQNIRLTYQVPLKASFISSLSVFATANNLLLITNYKGFDPDINTSGNSGSLALGRDNSSFPRPRVYSTGLNVKF